MGLLAWLMVGLAHGSTPVWSTDLQESGGGLSVSGDPGQWEWGAVESGPGAGLHGTQAWATRLQTVHMNDTDDRLTFPDVDLSRATRPVLVLEHWFDLEPDDEDLGVVEVFDGISWVPWAPVRGPDEVRGTSDGWQEDYFDLSGLASLSQVRLRFRSDTAVARDGWYIGGLQVLDGDPVPPVIEILDSPSDTQDLSGPYPVTVTTSDDVGVEDIYIDWYTADGAGSTPPLTDNSGGTWSGALQGQPPGTTYVWWVVATDAAGNEAFASGPVFRVYLPAPTDLTGPEDRVVAPTATLSWTAPESIWPIVDHRVYRDGHLVAVTGSTEVEAPVVGPEDRFTVSATFQTSLGEFEGDESAPVWVEAHPPTITYLSPAGGWPEDQLRIDLEGRYLLLQAGDITLDLGPGLTVSELEVVDVDRLRAFVELSSDATAGVRDVTLHTAGQDIVADSAFEVRSGDSRPRVLALSPARLVQGRRATVDLQANVALSADARVDLGEGVVVESVVEQGDRRIRLQVAAASDAPVGIRRVEADIGTRILTGDDLFRVVPPEPPPQTLCAAYESESSLGLLGILFYGLARRRQ